MTVKDIILSKINSPAARKVYDIACNYFGENVDIWTDERALNVYERTADERMIIGRSGYKYNSKCSWYRWQYCSQKCKCL